MPLLQNSPADNLRANAMALCIQVTNQRKQLEQALAQNPTVLTDLQTRYGADDTNMVKALINHMRDISAIVDPTTPTDRLK